MINLIRALHDAEQSLEAAIRSMQEAEYQLADSTDALSLKAMSTVADTYAKHLNALRAFHAGRAPRKEIQA